MFPGLMLPQYGGANSGFTGLGTPLSYGGIDQGIAGFEGYNVAGSRADRNNNPGNLQYGPFAQSHGATGADSGGFAVFPDTSSGFAATDALVGHYAQQGYSLRDLVNAWNPPNAPGNSPLINQNYVSHIAGTSGINPDTPLQSAGIFGSGSGYGILGSGNIFGNIFGSIPGIGDLFNGANLLGKFGIQNPVSNLLNGFSWGRFAAFILGLIFLTAGLYMFRPVNEIVNHTVKDAVA